ncbi:MAG: hypothetical protein AAFU79_23715, partial [Myxococcota bacterium]
MSSRRPDAHLVFGLLTAVGLLLNLYGAVWSRVSHEGRRFSGTSDAKDPAIWILWAGQGCLWLLMGAGLFLFPASLGREVDLGGTYSNGLVLAAGALVGLALASFSALWADQTSTWRTYALLFAVVHVLFGGLSLLAVETMAGVLVAAAAMGLA